VASPGGTRERAAKRRQERAAATAVATSAAAAAAAAAVAAATGEFGERGGCVLVGGGHAGNSRFKGVYWNNASRKWGANCGGKYLGLHTMEEDAARACSKYLKDGIDPVTHRDARTSHLAGVHWNKDCSIWKAVCNRKYLGLHTTETSAALAYNAEAERVGRPLNVVPPAGASSAGAGPGVGRGLHSFTFSST